MQTIISYKVVWVNQYGDMEEKDCNTEDEALDIQSSIPDSFVYKIAILGSIERIH